MTSNTLVQDDPMYRRFKRHFSAGPSRAQPAKRPLGDPGGGDVCVFFTPRRRCLAGDLGRQAACRAPREKALAQGAGGCSVFRCAVRPFHLMGDAPSSPDWRARREYPPGRWENV